MFKKIIFVNIAVLFLTSCSTTISETFYQICEVQSTLPKTSNGNYEYRDDACCLSYDFWCDGGNPGFVFFNNSDDIIYVNLAKSFFIRNGMAYDYFLNRTSSSSSSSMAEKSIIAIPPHSYKTFQEYIISPKYFYECEQNITPTRKETPTYNYNIENTPLSFSNYITYFIGYENTEHIIKNDFFVNEISYNLSRAITKNQKVGCPNNSSVVKVIIGSAPNKFYNIYIADTEDTESEEE